MKRPELDLTGQIIDGRFRVERLLGTGGMGTVWRAQHLQSLQFVALKTLTVTDGLPTAAIQRCLKEARAAASLKSRHVVRVIDVQSNYLHGDTVLPYLVMELLEGSDFESVLREREVLDVAETAWVMGQLCRGVQLAHEHGIVHRDLKPANLFLTVDDENAPIVKICDFGLAKLVHEQSKLVADGLSTETGAIIGTPNYMAPEQLRGVTQASGTLDQWAIGLIAFRLLSGRDYFAGAQSAVALSLRIVHDELPLPSRCSSLVPVVFNDWFLRSCQRDPARRFPSVMAQAKALQLALGNPVPVAVGFPSLRGTVQLRSPESGPLDPVVAPQNEVMPARPTGRFYTSLIVASTIGVFGTVALAAVFEQLPHQDAESSAEGTTAPATPRRRPSPARQFQAVATGALDSAPSSQDKIPTTELAVTRQRRRRAPLAGNNASMLQQPAPSLQQPAPTLPISTQSARTGLVPGSLCGRSIECASRLCVAERCR